LADLNAIRSTNEHQAASVANCSGPENCFVAWKIYELYSWAVLFLFAYKLPYVLSLIHLMHTPIGHVF